MTEPQVEEVRALELLDRICRREGWRLRLSLGTAELAALSVYQDDELLARLSIGKAGGPVHVDDAASWILDWLVAHGVTQLGRPEA